jgi:hypothetical protein
MNEIHVLVFLVFLAAVVRATRLDDQRRHDRRR